MANIGKLEVEVTAVTRYFLLFFPLAKVTKCGKFFDLRILWFIRYSRTDEEIKLFSVFGLPVYRRIGGVAAIFNCSFLVN